jgi:glycosyltransferase involved in cell wall biosynthesis
MNPGTSPLPERRLGILVVAPEFPPAIGGMEVHAEQIVRHLALRHDVVVLVPKAATEARDRAGTIDIRPVLSRRYGPNLWRAFRAAARLRPDVVLAMNAGYATLGALVACPVVTRVVGNDFYRAWVGPHLPLRFLFWRLPTVGRFSPGRWFRRADQRFRNWFVSRGLRQSAVILSNSSFTSGALAEARVEGSLVIRLLGGVDTARFRPRDRGEARRILGLPDVPVITTVARLARKKGIDTVLRALPEVLHRLPNLLYLIVGRGEEEGALQSQAGALGLTRNVRFLGTRPHADLPDILSAADLYVHCSRTAIDPVLGSRDVETMGRAVCEANACGLPALVSRSGGLPDVVIDGDTGLVIPEDDSAALADGLLRLLCDDALRHRMAHRALERARAEFSWDIVARRTEQALWVAIGPRDGSARGGA